VNREDRSIESRTQDQLAMRVEIQPEQEFNALYAAWLYGRLTNELRWRLQVAWIRGHDEEPSRTGLILADIHGLQRELESIDGGLATLARAIEILENCWLYHFRSESHDEEILEAESELASYHNHGSELPPSGEIGLLVSVARHTTGWLDSFIDSNDRNLLGSSKAAFWLGLVADGMIHPPLNHRGLRVPRFFQEIPPNYPIFSRDTPREVSHVRLGDLLAISEGWPDVVHLRDLQHRLASFCRLAEIEYPDEATDWNSETSIEGILGTIDHIVRGIDVRIDQTNEEISCEELNRRGRRFSQELGLEFNTREGSIRRGRLPTARLPPREMRLLVFFLNCENSTPSQWLAENWSRFSPRRNNVQLSTVHQAISGLNRSIESLELLIDRDETGYFVRDTRG